MEQTNIKNSCDLIEGNVYDIVDHFYAFKNDHLNNLCNNILIFNDNAKLDSFLTELNYKINALKASVNTLKDDNKKQLISKCCHKWEIDRMRFDPCQTMYFCDKCGSI